MKENSHLTRDDLIVAYKCINFVLDHLFWDELEINSIETEVAGRKIREICNELYKKENN